MRSMYHDRHPMPYDAWMRSLRLDPALEARLVRAAEVEGESVSEFIRQAVAQRADLVLAHRPAAQLEDVIGAIHGGGGQARRTGEALAEILAERRSAR
jgi:predicted transcriptional regulator